MTTNERIKEIVDKSLLEFYKSTITEEACGSMILKIRRGNLSIIIKNAILESTKDLSATIESQKKEIEVLDSRMKYLTRQIWDTRYIYGFNEQIKDMDYERLIGIAAEINSGNFTAIDSAISKQKE